MLLYIYINNILRCICHSVLWKISCLHRCSDVWCVQLYQLCDSDVCDVIYLHFFLSLHVALEMLVFVSEVHAWKIILEPIFNHFGWNLVCFKWLLKRISRLWPHNFRLHILYGSTTRHRNASSPVLPWADIGNVQNSFSY